ncbi:hypothetical protein BGZ54_008480, partial [Gamsiella multidivaricata]
MTKIKPRLIARISCQECRRRKTRCNFDGQGDKCSTCARIGTSCIFAQKNGVVLDIDKVMEENNPHLVHQREKEQRARERERERLSLMAGCSSSSSSSFSFAQSAGQHPIDMSLYSSSTPSSSFLAGYPNKTSRRNSASSLFPSTGVRSSSTEDLSQVMDRLQIDAFGIAPHTLRSFSQVAGDNDSAEPSSGESSATESHVTTVPGSVPDESSEGRQATQTKRNSCGNSPRHRSSRSRSVPLVDIQSDLIDLYFQHVHPYVLILHKPSFFRRLHDPKDPVPDFLLAAMYAVASHYAPGREEEGRRYFQLWLSRLDDTLDKPRLSTIQALLLIIKYQEGVKHTGFYFRTYMYAQMVIVLARELQLHKTTPVNVKLDSESHEVRRRLFWSIFVLDQFISISQGRSMSFREVEPEADFPCIDTEDPNDSQEIENIMNVVEYIKLAKINHQALILTRKFMTKVAKPEESVAQAQQIHGMMTSWRQNLPPRLQLASNMSAHTPFVAMLHMIHHTCSIMIQRCYGEDPTIAHHEIAVAARESCSVSATNITVITDDLFTNHGIVPLTYPIRGCYFAVYCLITAATIQANDIRRGVNGPIMFKRSLALLNVILRESTAVDIEKEVALLKNSVDIPMDDLRWERSAPPQNYDSRPPLKPILPMSQKYGSRMNYVASGMASIKMRKISPKVAGSSSASNATSSSTGITPQNPGTNRGNGQPKGTSYGGNQSNNHSNQNSGASSSSIGAQFMASASSTGSSSHVQANGGELNRNEQSAGLIHQSAGDADQGGQGQQSQGQPNAAGRNTWTFGQQNDRIQSTQMHQDQHQTLKIEEDQQSDDMRIKFKSSPSPNMSSLPYSPLSGSAQGMTELVASIPSSSDVYSRPAPSFAGTTAFPPDLNAFALPERQLTPSSNTQDPVSL